MFRESWWRWRRDGVVARSCFGAFARWGSLAARSAWWAMCLEIDAGKGAYGRSGVGERDTQDGGGDDDGEGRWRRDYTCFVPRHAPATKAQRPRLLVDFPASSRRLFRSSACLSLFRSQCATVPAIFHSTVFSLAFAPPLTPLGTYTLPCPVARVCLAVLRPKTEGGDQVQAIARVDGHPVPASRHDLQAELGERARCSGAFTIGEEGRGGGGRRTVSSCAKRGGKSNFEVMVAVEHGTSVLCERDRGDDGGGDDGGDDDGGDVVVAAACAACECSAGEESNG